MRIEVAFGIGGLMVVSTTDGDKAEGIVLEIGMPVEEDC